MGLYRKNRPRLAQGKDSNVSLPKYDLRMQREFDNEPAYIVESNDRGDTPLITISAYPGATERDRIARLIMAALNQEGF